MLRPINKNWLFFNGSCRVYGLLALALFLTACTAVLEQPHDVHIEEINNIAVPSSSIPRYIPAFDLTQDILYRLLLAEIALQRGQFNVAITHYVDLARAINDLRLIDRATQIAVYANDITIAEEMAEMWLELVPQASRPHKILATIALDQGDITKAMQHLDMIFAAGKNYDIEQKLWIAANLSEGSQNRDTLKSVLRTLMAGHQDDTGALFAYAQILARLEALPETRTILEKLITMQPHNENISIAYVTLLNRLGQREQALQWLRRTLEDNDDNLGLRIFYARLLADNKYFHEARQQFEALLAKDPGNPNVLLSVGLLYLHENQLDNANKVFTRLLEIEKYTNDASYYLARIAEERASTRQAIDWYRKVSSDGNYFEAQIRIGLLLAKQNKLQEAQAHLRNIYASNQQESDTLIMAEVEILSMAERYQEAMDIYNKVLEDRYDADLLYARAMLAGKMGTLNILERDLLLILENDPNDARALNALGYTLADKTDRYDEAYELIKRAIEISPDEHHIIDSMGWVLYRRGQLDAAAEFLHKAMTKQEDPEIAAHLGEVLWMKGDRAAACKVWESSLKKFPDDEKLYRVIEHFSQ